MPCSCGGTVVMVGRDGDHLHYQCKDCGVKHDYFPEEVKDEDFSHLYAELGGEG